MSGLTPLGIFHTLISLAALVTAGASLLRGGRIDARSGIGQAYVWLTIASCVTGFGIFQHGGFGKPHALGIATLATLALAALAGRGLLFAAAAPYVETVAYTLTVFFHIVPALAETSTRLPPGAPLLASPDAPELQVATAVCFVVFLAAAVYQLRRLRRSLHSLPRVHGLLHARRPGA